MKLSKSVLAIVTLAVVLGFGAVNAEAGACLKVLEKGLSKLDAYGEKYNDAHKAYIAAIKKSIKAEGKDKEKVNKTKLKLKAKRDKVREDMDAFQKSYDGKVKKCIEKKLKKADKNKFKKGWNKEAFEKSFEAAQSNEDRMQKRFRSCEEKEGKSKCQKAMQEWLEAEKDKYRVIDAAIK